MTAPTTTTPTHVATPARPQPTAPAVPRAPMVATPLTLTCAPEHLKRGLAIVGHAVAGRSTLPVLSNVLLAADAGRLKLAATDLEVGLTCWVDAQITTPGAVTVPAKLLADVVGSLPDEQLNLTLDERTQTLNLTCARFETNIKGIAADEFPTIPPSDPAIPDARRISFRAPQLRQAINQVAFAAAADDTRPVLAGVLIRLNGSTATFAAADGFRLALRRITLPGPVAEPWEALIPARALATLARVLGDDAGTVEVTITPTDGQVVFHSQRLDLVARLIDSTFPDFERIIPRSCPTHMVLETRELTRALRLAALVGGTNGVTLTLTPSLPAGRLTIQAHAAEVGANQAVLDGALEGPGGQMVLNVKFLAEIVSTVTTPNVALELQTPTSPAVIKPVGGTEALALLMPMSMS